MKKRQFPIGFLGVLIVTLAAGCISQLPVLKPEPIPTAAYPRFYSEYLAEYFMIGDRDDGVISLTIQDVDGGCHDLGQPIKIMAIIKNISNEPLWIPDLFTIDTHVQGNNTILALLWPVGNHFYPPIKYHDFDFSFGVPKSEIYLPAEGKLEKILYYSAPMVLHVHDMQGRSMFYNPKPGNYYLGFLYNLIRTDDKGRFVSKDGFALSNTIKLCLGEFHR